MATELRKRDVVIIGLGAAGGVAALPLARAGLDVIGLEAGTWLTADFAPDELRNNVRGWPQAVQKANREIPTHRPNASAPLLAAARRPSDDERRRRHVDPLLGAELAAQSVGLQGRERNHAALRRLAHPEGLDRRGLAVRSRRTRAVLRQGRVRDRRLGQGRQHQRQDRPARQHLRRAAQARVSDAGAARHRIHRDDGRGRAEARLASVSGTRRDQFSRRIRTAPAASITATARAAAATSMRRARPPSPRSRRRRRPAASRSSPRRTSRDRGRRRGPRRRGVTYVKGGDEYFQPAEVVLLASYTYENVRLLLLSKSKAFPNGLSNNHGQVGRHYFSHHQSAAVTALFPFESEQLVRHAGAGRRGRQLGRRQLRSLGARLHRRRQSLGVFRPAADRGRQHEHVRQAPTLGLGVEGVRQAERRPLEHRLPAEDDAALRRQLPRPRSRR